LPAVVVNPAQVRAFAKALGQRAKTDPIDAIAHLVRRIVKVGDRERSGSRRTRSLSTTMILPSMSRSVRAPSTSLMRAMTSASL
jgi:transposase